jgi:hypothetical protein
VGDRKILVHRWWSGWEGKRKGCYCAPDTVAKRCWHSNESVLTLGLRVGGDGRGGEHAADESTEVVHCVDVECLVRNVRKVMFMLNGGNFPDDIRGIIYESDISGRGGVQVACSGVESELLGCP